VERKQAADHGGPHRRQPRVRAHSRSPQVKLDLAGLFHGMADGLKMMLKETSGRRPTTRSATRWDPGSRSCPVLLVFAVIPFGGTLDPGRLIPPLADWFGGRTYPLQIARLDAGLLVVFAFGGITIIGAMLAGWSSNNKFSLLGALRAGSQMISYEVVMALTILGLVLIWGTVDLTRSCAAVRARVPLPSRLGHRAAAFRRDPLPGRRDRREQAHPLRPSRSRERAHRRLLHRVQRDEDGPLHVRGIHRDRDRRRALHHALPRRLQPAVHERRGIPFGGARSACRTGSWYLPSWASSWQRSSSSAASRSSSAGRCPRFRYDQLLAFAWKFMFPLALANLGVDGRLLAMERA
jgi:hypothetical protein